MKLLTFVRWPLWAVCGLPWLAAQETPAPAAAANASAAPVTAPAAATTPGGLRGRRGAPAAAPTPPIDQNNIPPPFTSAKEVYSGISGPGKPLVGNGGGGYRSGVAGVKYDGPDSKPGWTPLGQYAATGSAVKEGLIPPLKPIWDLHLRDTVIIVGGDGKYYMTGSTGDNIWDRNDGIELYRSDDLKKWDYVGLVWSFEKDATWQKLWRNDRGHVIRDIWAPELHYIKGNYYLVYCLAGGGGTGILKSTTGKPEGPYQNCLVPDARLTGGIDGTLFEDDDGKVYFTWGHGDSLNLMKDDMSGFAGPPIHIQMDEASNAAARAARVPAGGICSEGPSLFKANGHYYLGGAQFMNSSTGRYSSVVAMSDNLAGPYHDWIEAVPCGGGTNYFKDKEGNWWCAYFGNDEQTPYREKPGLVKIDFEANGRIKIADTQPAFVLQDGTPANWRSAVAPSTANVPPATTTPAAASTPPVTATPAQP